MWGRNELEIPEPARRNKRSKEVLRVWVIEGEGQHVCLQPHWKDPAAWGLMISDLIVHVTNAYEQAAGANPQAVRERILAALKVELEHPTDTPEGRFE